MNFKSLTLCICIVCLSIFFASIAQANTVNIICDLNGEALSQQFVMNWEHSIKWYSSKAQDKMGDLLAQGGMRTVKDVLPIDNNPHLRFLQAEIWPNSEEGVTEVDCTYLIQNKDLLDGPPPAPLDHLYMRMFMVANSCKIIEHNAVQCDV